jgi:cytochrome c oxidase accessory protein FixG
MEKNKEEFRDHLGNQDKAGKRKWLYPKIIKGKLYRYREYVSYFLLFFLFVTPWIKINGHPFMLFNVVDGKYVLFGQVFWPHDFNILAFMVLTALIFVVLFTAIFGRVWCGWACPQTIFMEMVFRRIETWIEGSPNKRKKLDDMPWNGEKVRKKGLKHFLFLLISFLISNTFLAYIIGSEELIKIIKEPISQHIGGFMGIVIFTIVFYIVFTKVRELVCIMICPYGRLQGVLLDKASKVVIYDHVRGEPRGKVKKKEDQSHLGDCIDCNQCVEVCPTGIDIRNGTQLECVNCTICIDACDSIMEKINKPLGLIRVDSSEAVEEKKQWKFTPRVIAYLSFLVLMVSVLTFAIITRKEVSTTVFRAKGTLYTENKQEKTVSNIFNAEFVNKTFTDIDIRLIPKTENLKLKIVDKAIRVPSGDIRKAVLILSMNQENIKENSKPIMIEVYQGEELVDEIETTFLGPVYD